MVPGLRLYREIFTMSGVVSLKSSMVSSKFSCVSVGYPMIISVEIVNEPNLVLNLLTTFLNVYTVCPRFISFSTTLLPL